MQAFRHPRTVSIRFPGAIRSTLLVHASKGFAKGKDDRPAPKKLTDDEASQATKRRANKTKGKQAARAPIPVQRAPLAAPPTDVQEPQSLVDQIEFEQRLAALKAESKERRVEGRPLGQVSLSDIDPLALPPSKVDPYANPPALSETLFGSKNKTANDREYEGQSFGPSQVGLAVVSLALVGVFLVANGGSELGYASKSRRAAAGGPQIELSAETKSQLTTQLTEFEAKVAADATDAEAIEGAAVVNARLGSYDKAVALLEKLVALRPDSPDAWRVLAECRSGLGDAPKAIEAYRKAWAASKESSLEVLQGLTAELADAGDAKSAVALLRATAASPAAAAVGEVEVQLLLAKALGQWGGHTRDAVAQYDSIMEAHPDDFRAPLGKGLVLQGDGQPGDAARYFLQARYLAPAGSKGAVEAIIAQAQAQADK